jgi:hypothetical protein
LYKTGNDDRDHLAKNEPFFLSAGRKRKTGKNIITTHYFIEKGRDHVRIED